MFDFKNFVFSQDAHDIFEGMTSISAVIKSVLDGSSDRQIFAVIYDASKAQKKMREMSYINKMAEIIGFDVIATDAYRISDLTSGDTHGGIIAITSKRSFSDNIVNYLTNSNFFVLIDGIEDPYNFGYSVRSLYAAGADGIILPQRNWMELSGVVAKSSAGTSELAKLFICDTYEAAKLLKEHGYKVVCASIRDSVSLYDYDFNQPVLLVVGGEKRGISRKLLELSDANVRIDYGREFMGSLPSASAVSVIAFEISRQKSLKTK